MDERLKQITHEVRKETGEKYSNWETMPDHVHLLVDCGTRYGINRPVRLARGGTSGYLRSEFPSL